MSLILDKKELEELTGKIRPSAQARELNAMGIDFRQRRDGSIVVLRSDVSNDPKHSARLPTLNLEAI